MNPRLVEIVKTFEIENSDLLLRVDQVPHMLGDEKMDTMPGILTMKVFCFKNGIR